VKKHEETLLYNCLNTKIYILRKKEGYAGKRNLNKIFFTILSGSSITMWRNE